jgi:ribosomal protein S18 acetylase RimI-like enzyme
VIRKYQPGEERELYDICLLTGDSGEDASGLYRDPALDASGVAGYVLGAPDTVGFEQTCEQSWWPPLRDRYPLGTFAEDTPDDRIVRLIHNPPTASPDVVERYPAHLHIDLLPRLQGRGAGRQLITTLFDSLAAVGVPGVHLGVSTTNPRAIGFYRHMGFTEVRTHTHSLVMARML